MDNLGQVLYIQIDDNNENTRQCINTWRS